MVTHQPNDCMLPFPLEDAGRLLGSSVGIPQAPWDMYTLHLQDGN